MAPKTPPERVEIEGPEDTEVKDPAFEGSLDGIGIDPDQTEYRDRMALDASEELGGINAELREQEAQRERDLVDTLEAMRSLDHGESVQWRISRTGSEDEGMDGFLATWPTSRMTLERIRDKFGGGKYYVKGFRNGRYVVHKTIVIAGPPKVLPKDSPMNQNPNGSGTGQSFDLERFMAQQDIRDRARRREEEDREERNRKNRMELIAIIATPLATLGAAVLGNRQPGTDVAALITALKPDRPEFGPVEMMKVMRELREMNPSAPQTSAIDQAMSLVDRIKEMGGFSGNGGSEVGLWDIAKELAKTLGPGLGEAFKNLTAQAAAAKMLEAQRATQLRLPSPTGVIMPAAPPSLNPAPSATAPPSIALSPQATRTLASIAAAAPPAAPGHPQEGDDEMLLALLPLVSWLKGETERLLIAASRGSDPELRAAAMFDDLPDDADLQSIAQVLSRSDWLKLFTQLDARVAQHEPFFAQVREHLLGMIQEELGAAHGAGAAHGTSIAPAGAPAPSRAPKKDTGEIERPAGPPSLGGGPAESV